MKRRTLITLLAIITVVLVGAYTYKEYNRKPADLTNAKASRFVNAKTLVSAYLLNEEEANNQYLGKIIEVEGTVLSMEAESLIIGDANAANNVSCSFDSASHAYEHLPPVGKEVKVRGVCTGFLIDVELIRCVILND